MTPIQEMTNGSFFPMGNRRIAYNRTSAYTWQRWWTGGGMSGAISIYDLKSNTYSNCPTREALLVSDGRRKRHLFC